MPNFDEILKQTKADHDARTAAENASAQADAEALRSQEQAAIDLLEKSVVPLLEQAIVALRGQGVEARIEKKFDVLNRAGFAMPSVNMMVLGPKRSKDGYQYQAEPVTFAADQNGGLHVSGNAPRSGSAAALRLSSAKGGQIEDAVTKGVSAAYQNYLAEKPTWDMMSRRM